MFVFAKFSLYVLESIKKIKNKNKTKKKSYTFVINNIIVYFI